MKLTSYVVRRYRDGVAIGGAQLSVEQFAHYEAMAQQPEGIIRLGALPHEFYDLDPYYQDTGEDVSVYLD